MEIIKNKDNKKMTIELIGRLDTTTCGELSDALKDDIDSTDELIFDFAGLEYVSSAGLRTLLTAQKTMNKRGKMLIKNVCDEVMDVFEITGFNELLSIE